MQKFKFIQWYFYPEHADPALFRSSYAQLRISELFQDHSDRSPRYSDDLNDQSMDSFSNSSKYSVKQNQLVQHLLLKDAKRTQSLTDYEQSELYQSNLFNDTGFKYRHFKYFALIL
jgi:hypothetical protein